MVSSTPLLFRNTLSGEVEPFKPLSPKEVKMYNCGPTVYGPQHIGNLRAAVFADTTRRVLELWDYSVKQVINITDVGHLTSDADEGNDKMTEGLKREGMGPTLENMRAMGEQYAQAYCDDIARLNVLTDKIRFPRASDYIREDTVLISTLIEKGYAYVGKKNVYFDVSRFPAYGKLGGIALSGLKAGARVAQDAEKRGPYDFVLWKMNKKLGWDSPWGTGFPGWHIECTAMIFALLGKQIDIHTGGIEHIPVHHNNEIAQAEAASGKRYVTYWLHNDHITIEGKKISKSLGNTVYLHQIVERGVPALALRYWYLTGHYRSPMNFTWDALSAAATALNRLHRVFFEELASASTGSIPAAFEKDVRSALGNDLGTPQALAHLWNLIKDESVSPADKKAALLWADQALGLGLTGARPAAKLSVKKDELPSDVQALVDEREAARADKNFARADELRAAIEAVGFEVKDTADGPQLTKK